MKKSSPNSMPTKANRPKKSSVDFSPESVSELTQISVRGAREHNLKNVDIDLPKKSLIVFTGVSGSGKSSLAFDTIFAEGQRRYVESLSAYARQFLGQMEKPKFDTIRGLSPAISIEQKAASKNPRSTVGTITEIYDYLRVLYARLGTQHCHICDKVVGRGDAASMVTQILSLPEGTKFLLLAPLVENRKGEHRDKLAQLKQEGYSRVRIDGVVREITDVQTLAKNKKHNIEAVIDRLIIKKDKEFKSRVTDSVENALKLGSGRLILHVIDREDIPMSEARSCCGFAFPQLDPPLFSFNSPLGMCTTCHGLGAVLTMDEAKVIPDQSLTIREGAIAPWRGYFVDGEINDGWGGETLRALEKQLKINFDVPWKNLPAIQKKMILHGSDQEIKLSWKGKNSQGSWKTNFEGLLPRLMRRFQETQSDAMKDWYGKFMTNKKCKSCQGRRLRPEILSVRIQGRSIIDLSNLTIADAYTFLSDLTLSDQQKLIAAELLKEIRSRLGFLVNVGLNYLSLDRKGPTLSGGEAQRIRLASQIGSELTGVLYILDEPSIGLHQRDNSRLLATLKHLRDIGNTLIVVEHDQETMEAADWLVDLGPGAGHLGGQVVVAGTPDDVKAHPASLTGSYLTGRAAIEMPVTRRKNPDPKAVLTISGATENNLRNITAKIPLGIFTAITGVSGAGKSTLVNQILFPALASALHQAETDIGAHGKITGIDQLDKVINIDQKPIGRTPRSNPATYTKLFDLIRDLFAELPDAKVRGFQKGRFSFNVKGGRCEQCEGDGQIRVEMHFLADVFVPCEVCQGRRFNEATLEVKFKGHSIADILEISVSEARTLFSAFPKLTKILDTIIDVGLGYMKLGQSATTMSGGEAQRIKLSRELAKRDTGKTLYILDEPTTGLHFEDIRKLLSVLQRLVESGNTIVVIEHNLDVIKSADWIIDMGPEGGQEGGAIIAEGTPEEVAKMPASYTGQYLAPLVLNHKIGGKNNHRKRS